MAGRTYGTAETSMNAAKMTRCTAPCSSAPASVIDTISPTSITVTATASRIEPNGSPKLERQHLRVIDGREDRRAEEETGEDQDERGVGGNDMREFQRQQAAGEDRNGPSPGRNGGMVRTDIGAFRCEDAA